ncbi:hypothetical protein J5T34_06690 [Cupriavidus gilardii]|uniref:hypothetical protein n=1 Tax=Cupriavidus gilardii TaxID=82541 RepID=UPI001ABDA7A7|nr:hypothetical protein [Cupriavidus gilardii]MBO4120429.1 hypothetical protein [Cupriavidus gilardii]
MSKVSLSKYNVPIKERRRVTRAPRPERVAASTKIEQVFEGQIVVINRADSTTVEETARQVIQKHHEAIERLARR